LVSYALINIFFMVNCRSIHVFAIAQEIRRKIAQKKLCKCIFCTQNKWIWI